MFATGGRTEDNFSVIPIGGIMNNKKTVGMILDKLFELPEAQKVLTTSGVSEQDVRMQLSLVLDRCIVPSSTPVGDCGVASGGHRCERPKGHTGYHESYGWHGRSEQRW